MTKTTSFLDAALAEAPSAIVAMDALLCSDDAAQVLIDAIAAGREPRVASALLSLLSDRDLVTRLAPLALARDRDVRSCAITALGRLGDPRAVAVLTETHAKYGHLLIVIDALGELPCPGSTAALYAILSERVGELATPDRLAELCARAEQDRDPTDLLAVAAVARSLARLGDFALVEPARVLARYVPEESLCFHQASLVRLKAISALDVAIGPGILPTLLEAVEDPDIEVQESAISATLHVGRVQVVEHWVRAVGASHGALREPVVGALSELVGERPAEEAGQLLLWWQRRAERFARDICYRWGAPASPAKLIARARGEHSAPARLELQQMTGLPFLVPELSHAPHVAAERLDAWWLANQAIFAPGKLHRWGRAYEPSAVD